MSIKSSYNYLLNAFLKVLIKFTPKLLEFTYDVRQISKRIRLIIPSVLLQNSPDFPNLFKFKNNLKNQRNVKQLIFNNNGPL